MAIGCPNLRMDVVGPLRLGPYAASQALLAGPLGHDPNLEISLPNGMELAKPDQHARFPQLRLQISPYYKSKNRRSGGYVSDIRRVDRRNTSPLMATSVLKIPFAY